MNTKELIAKAISMPVEKRALIVDSLLKSLNPSEQQIDKKWIAVAKKRLDEIRTGKVELIPGEEVFNKVWKKFSV